MQDSLVIVLNGGFGNQMFQLAKAIELSDSFNVSINTTIGVTPKTNSGVPSIFDYFLPNSISVDQTPVNLVNQKIIKLLISTRLRSFRNPLVGSLSQYLHKALRWVFLFFSTQWSGVLITKNISDTRLNVRPGRNLVVGYFQTTKWQDEKRIHSTMANLRHKKGSSALEEYEHKADLEHPLVLHIRMGDYRNEQSIGMIDEKYIELALEYALKKNQFKNIWLFSDEPEEAMALIPARFLPSVEIIKELENSPTLTQEVMRLGAGYVLSNSTFGWWAAYLARMEPKVVVVPDPWFKKIDEPLGLIPSGWTRIPR
jgi:hypothetical protein